MKTLPSLPRASFVLGAALLVTASCRPPEPAVAYGPEPSQPMVEYVMAQEILTPLPLRVSLPSRYGADRVLVFVKTWGSRRWSTLELARAGQTWTGEVSCREVSTVTGDTRYYFLAVDPENKVVIGSGWPEWPHVATVVSKLPEGPQALAGTAVPDRCHDPADCPPDFIGCPAYALHRPACHEDADCSAGRRCDWDGYCSDVAGDALVLGESDDDGLDAAVEAALHKRRHAASMLYTSAR